MDVLPDVIRQHSTHQVIDEEFYTRELWSGFDNPYKDEILDNSLYEDEGLFRFLIAQKRLPRIVSAVRYRGSIVSYSMVVSSNDFMGEAYHPHMHCLGFLGAWTRDNYRNIGLAKKSIQGIEQYLRGHIYGRQSYGFLVQRQAQRLFRSAIREFMIESIEGAKKVIASGY